MQQGIPTTIPNTSPPQHSHSHLPTLRNHHIIHRPTLPPHPRILHLQHNIHALDHLPKNNMLIIEIRRRDRRDEELAAVGVGAGVLYVEKSERGGLVDR